MRILNLTSSRFFGGPERQMLGLARHLPDEYETHFVSFSEDGCCSSFLAEVESAGMPAQALVNDTPRLWAATDELVRLLGTIKADVLLCHGYKGDLLGWRAARRAGIPAVAVSRGWTAESLKVRAYEAVDRRVLRKMDCVVCVSEGQAKKVRQSGVAADRVRVIHNAVDPERFASPDPASRKILEQHFPNSIRRIVLAAGRLSPEKGINVLIDAAGNIVRRDDSVGVIVFGEGAERPVLQRQIDRLKLERHVKLAGFRADIDQLLPSADVLALPSFTEGLPNVILEAFACGVPVVATPVGGVPEIIEDGRSGFLVPVGDAEQMAARIIDLLSSAEQRAKFSLHARETVASQFTFSRQAAAYLELFEELTGHPQTTPELASTS